MTVARQRVDRLASERERRGRADHHAARPLRGRSARGAGGAGGRRRRPLRAGGDGQGRRRLPRGAGRSCGEGAIARRPARAGGHRSAPGAAAEARLRLPDRADHVLAHVRLAGHLAARSRGPHVDCRRPTRSPRRRNRWWPGARRRRPPVVPGSCSSASSSRRLRPTTAGRDRVPRTGPAPTEGSSDGLVTLSWEAGGRFRSAR